MRGFGVFLTVLALGVLAQMAPPFVERTRAAQAEAPGARAGDPVADANRLLAEGRIEEARDRASAAVREMPSNPDAWKALGFAERKSGRFYASEEAYEKALSLRSDDTEALFWLGTLRRWAGDWKGSRHAFEAALRLSPDDTEAKIGLARVALHDRDLDEAGALVDQVLAKYPENPEALTLKGAILESRGDRSGALESYGRAVDRSPMDDDALGRFSRLREDIRPTPEMSATRTDRTVLEAREEPTPFRMRYLSNEVSWSYGQEVLRNLRLGARAELGFDALKDVGNARTVYDLRSEGVTGILGAWNTHGYSLRLEPGFRSYKDRGKDASVAEEEFFVLSSSLGWRGRGGEASLGFDRRPVLVRGLDPDSPVYFDIETVNVYRASGSATVAPGVLAVFRGSIADYSDGNTKPAGSAGFDLSMGRHTFGPRVQRTPVQRWEVDGANGKIRFVDMTGGALFYRGLYPGNVALSGRYSFEHVSDGNDVHRYGLRAEARELGGTQLYLGASEDGNRFREPSGGKGYVSYDEDAVRAYAGIRSDRGVRTAYDLSYAHGLHSDEISKDYYHSNEVRGSLRLLRASGLDLTAEASWTDDTLDQDAKGALLRLSWSFR